IVVGPVCKCGLARLHTDALRNGFELLVAVVVIHQISSVNESAVPCFNPKVLVEPPKSFGFLRRELLRIVLEVVHPLFESGEEDTNLSPAVIIHQCFESSLSRTEPQERSPISPSAGIRSPL